jgi:hypothetical protein
MPLPSGIIDVPQRVAVAGGVIVFDCDSCHVLPPNDKAQPSSRAGRALKLKEPSVAWLVCRGNWFGLVRAPLRL